MMGGINAFDESITSQNRQVLHCDADNIWNLRRYILQLILDDSEIQSIICMWFDF